MGSTADGEGGSNPSSTFEAWWNDLQTEALSQVKRWIRSEDLANDVVQSLALLAYDAYLQNRFRDRSHFRKWIFQRSKWLTIDLIRWIATRREEALESWAGLQTDEPSEVAIYSELRTQLTEQIAKLPDEQKKCMELLLDGLKPTQIARRLKKNPQTVRSIIRAARIALASQLPEE